jgi:hypothetical protein
MNTLKFIRILPLSLALVGAASLSSAAAEHEGHNMDGMAGMTAKSASGKLIRVTDKDAAWAAKATVEYPTDVCVVSGDKLGADMGKPQDFIYREEGKPDRLVRFCCKDCIKDFNKEPAKFLKAIDDAAAKKTKSNS